MPDTTPTALEATGLRLFGQEFAAGFMSEMRDLLRLGKETPSEEEAAETAKKKAEEEATEAGKGDGEGDGKDNGDGDGKGEEAGYDDLNKGAEVDVTAFLEGISGNLQTLAKGMGELGAAHAALSADLAAARAENQELRAKVEELKTTVTAGHLALARLGDQIIDPLVKAVATRPEGVIGGMPATPNPAGAAARMGGAAPATAEFTDVDLAKAVAAGVLTNDQHVLYKFDRRFSADPKVDEQIRTNLTATLKA